MEIRDIRSVAVLGAGTMGAGIAQVSAMAGFRTLLYDVDAERAEAGLSRIRSELAKGVERGKVEAATRDRALAALEIRTALPGACDGVDLVIEAVPEDLALKISVLREAAEAAGPDAVIASNTSALSLTEIAQALPDPSRVVGMHFFNPVPRMKLLEIVRAYQTSEETLAVARHVAERMGKEAIVVQDVPGFASSRLGIALGLEAMRMVEEGVASPEAIDKAMELGYRHPMGPLRLTDLVGLDVRLDIARYLHEALGSDRFRPPEILERMVAEGRLGQKTGQGFYTWNE